jgi:hypothetical protein
LRGLEAGADDYMMKPFHGKELLLRLENVIRRSRRQERTVQSVEPFETNLDQYALNDIDTVPSQSTKIVAEALELVERSLSSFRVVSLREAPYSKVLWLAGKFKKLGPEERSALSFAVVPLIERAKKFLQEVRCEEALALLETVNDLLPGHEEAAPLRMRLRELLMPFYLRVLEPLERRPRLRRERLTELQVHTPEITFLLANIDGQTSLADLLRLSPYHRFDVVRSLYHLNVGSFLEMPVEPAREKKRPTGSRLRR